ncbi:MAG: hypothetical protein ACYC91_00095 [Solirubrobacteraceae bacterium]
MRNRSLRRSALAVIALAAALAFVGSAQAGVLVSSATSCSAESLSQPFLPWLDVSHYTLAPGGSFETGAAPWTLTGGAAVGAGNESFQVGATPDSQSLTLPDASSATSPSMCVGIDHPTLRFFARNTGSSLSTLAVSVQFEDSFGNRLSAPVGLVSSGSSWQPTLPMAIGANLLALLPGDETAVSFQFTPAGTGGGWQIDDVYVDPWGRG